MKGPPQILAGVGAKSLFFSKGLKLWLMGIYGTSKLPKFYRTDFKHDLYCCTWRWLEHTVPHPPRPFGSIGTDVNAAGTVCMTLELPDQGLVMQIPDSNVAITAAAEAHF